MSDRLALLERAQQGDGSAEAQLLTENAGLIWSIVRRYNGCGVETDDLYQLGCIGFVKAVKGFDLTYGTQFSTYAVPKIAGEIRRFLRDDGPIKVGRTMREKGQTLWAARERLQNRLGYEPRLSQLAEETGMTPEEVLPKDKADEIALKLMCLADLESLCSYTRLRELAEADENGRVVVIPRQKNEEERLERRRLMRIMADGAIHRLMENPLKEKNGPDIAELRVVNTDRLLELAKADEDGRIFLLPMEPGRSMLCQEYFERPWVMKNVTLCVQYQSSTGIVFYMGYDVFRGLVERGRITPLSQEGEEMLEGKANV